MGIIELRKIDKENFEECIGLKVTEIQDEYVASNVYSLAQAWVSGGNAYPFAIYADGGMVGFVMMGYYAEKKIYDIWRFMIDKRFQGRGYGKEALGLAVSWLREKFDPEEIFLSFVPGNDVAERMYYKAGFRKTGEMDDDELIMRLDCLNPPGPGMA